MPTITTLGTASARAYGLFGGLTVIAGPYWIATLGGSAADQGNGIAVDSLGNSYIAGQTASQGAGSTDALITKYNTSGTIQWQRVLGGSGIDLFNGVALDSSFNVYAVGRTASQGAGSNDVILTKYDSSGTIQWQKLLGLSASDEGNAIAIDGSNNIYITGYYSSNNLLIAKYDSSGTIQWQRALTTSTNNGNGIRVTSAGTVYVVGFSSGGGGQGSNDVLLTKYDTSGTIQWQRVLGGASSDVGNAIAIDSSENLYVAGSTQSQGLGSTEILVAKYDSSGAIQWQRILGTVNADVAYGVALDSSANVYITGYGNGSDKLQIAKYNSSGTIQWQRRLVAGSAVSNQGNGISTDPSGNIYIAGQTAGTGAGGSDVVITKLPNDGSLTGTYGPWTYSVTTLTGATSTLVSATSTLTASTPSLTSATATLTDAASTLTSTVNTL